MEKEASASLVIGMAKTSGRFDEYWRKYFERVDTLAPPPGFRAAALSGARKIVCYSCKDGTLFWFDKGDLQIDYKTSGLNVETLLGKLTAPLGLNFDKPSDERDIGPVNLGEVSVGQTTALPVFFYRVIAYTGSGPMKDPVSRANDDAAQPQKGSVWGIDAKKASIPGKRN